MVLLRTLLVLFLILVTFHQCNLNPNESDNQTFKEKMTLNEYDPETAWPSFTGNSYIYLLGLFIKRQNSLLNHPQTFAEPIMFRVAILLSHKYNITVNGRKFAYHLANTSGEDVIETLYHTCHAISENQILGIVGPGYSDEARTLSRFANRVGLPVIGYSTTDPALSNRKVYKTFYRLPPSDIVTAKALFKLYQKYQWNSTNVIYQSDNYGEGGLMALTEVFHDQITISRTIKYDLSTGKIDRLKRQLTKSPSRIVVVWANAKATMKIIELALKAGNIMAPSFLWIFVAHNLRMQIVHHKNVTQLSGMLILRLTKPNISNILKYTDLMQDATAIWKKYDPQSYPADETQIDTFALYAFDAAWLLILAIQKFYQQDPTNCLSFHNISECFLSQLNKYKELHQIIQMINFTGVSGYVQFQKNTTDRINSAIVHYMVDNLQQSSANVNELQVVDVLKLNDSEINIERDNTTQWIETDSLIQWPNRMLGQPKDYALLKNQLLNITVYISEPFFMMQSDQNNISQPLGYIPDLVRKLQEQLNFNYTFFIAPANSSYGDLVDCVKNGTYQVLMADLTITSSRADKVAFSHPIYDNTMRLVIRKHQRANISPFAFFNTFSLGLWLLILVIIYFGSSLLIAMYESFEKHISQKDKQDGDIYHSTVLITIVRALYHTTGALLQRDADLQPKTFFSCVQTAIVWIMSVILVSLLTSNLIVYFNAQVEKPWLQSVDDINKICDKMSCKRIGILEHSQIEEYFTEEVMKEKKIDYYHLKHPNEIYTKLLDGDIHVALADSASADYFTQKPNFSQLETTGTPFGRSYYGIAFSKQWPYKEDLDKHIIKLKTSGEIDRLQKEWSRQGNSDHKPTNDSFDQYGLTIQETSGVFYIFAIVTGLNLLVFVMKLIWCLREWPSKNQSPSL